MLDPADEVLGQAGPKVVTLHLKEDRPARVVRDDGDFLGRHPPDFLFKRFP